LQSLIQIDDKIHNKLIHGFISIDSIVNNVNPTTLLKHILEIMVTDYIITKKVDETKLSILYKNLKDFFYNEDIDFITLAPLHDFDSDGFEPIPISSSLTIRKIGLEEKIAYMYNRKNTDKLFAYDTKWVLEHKTTMKNNLHDCPYIKFPDFQLVESSFASVIILLRLFDFGNFGTNTYIRYVPLNVPIQPFILSNLKISGFESITDNGRYIFKSEKLNEFKDLWQRYEENLIKILDFKMDNNDSSMQIRNAIDRFNFSYQKVKSSDNIVDYVIALESMLLNLTIQKIL
jgi:hypothetical protein